MKFLDLVSCTWVCSSVSEFIAYGNLNRICILLLCENCVNLGYVELVHGAFQIYYILLWSVTQLRSTLCDRMDGSPPGSSVHGIFQARILGWVAISSSLGSPPPRDQTGVSRIVGRPFTIWATRGSLTDPNYLLFIVCIHCEEWLLKNKFFFNSNTHPRFWCPSIYARSLF